MAENPAPAPSPSRSARPWHVRLKRRLRLDYLKILRTEGAPSQVARGVGYGIFVELIFFPTLGLAFILIYPLNRFFRGHLAASIAGFVFAKLFAWATIPPSIIVGKALMGSDTPFDFKGGNLGETIDKLKEFFAQGLFWEFLVAWNLGAAIFGVAIGLAGYFITRSGLMKYQALRKERREQILREKETRINTDENTSENS